MIAASPYLKIFLVEHYLNPCRYDYNIVFSRRLSGPIDIKKLEFALEKTIKESVILNSHLYVDDETKIYWKENYNNSKFSYFKDISKKDTFIKTPFDLFKGPLYRFALFEIDKNTHDLVIILHHCLIDGGSVDVFISRISSYYNGIPIKKFSTLENQIEIIANSSNLLKKNINFLHEKKKGQKFWQRRLKDFSFRNTLPYIRSKESSKKVGIKKFKVNKTSLLQTMSSRLAFSYFNILSTIWGILVAKYCNSYESTMLFPISVRNIDKELYGAYLNTLVNGIDISNNKSYDQLASEYKKAIEELKIDSNNKYSYYPIYDVIHALKAKETNVSFGRTNIKEKKFNFKQCKESINLEDEVDIAGSELYLGFEENANSFTFKLYYNTKLFKEYQIVEIIRCYENLLLKISSNPYEAITKIDLVDKETKDKLLYKWNDTDRAYPSNKTIHALFEEQVVKSPNNIAVIYEDVKLTYKELNERVNQLAHYLIKQHNIKANSLITLLLDRSECMIISILGVLKAGAAYVPINPEYPEDRIKYIIEDTKTDIVITNEIYNKKVNKINKKVSTIAIDGNIQELDKYLTTNPIVGNLTGNNLSYIIYTSGTTGKPKGVQIEHHSVVNILLYLNKNIYNKHKQNITAFTSYTFDMSVAEFFCALISGNSLNILSNTTKKDALLISKYINEHSINYLYLLPVVLSQLPRVKYKTLDKIVYGGEPCDRNTALYWSRSCKLYNSYGPTEGTIGVTGREIINDNVGSIGSPIANSKAYVLSSELLPVPIGAIGELYLSGVGLARGYLNKPDLTKEKFIPNPFQSDKERQTNKNSRLYKTGDLVRWLPFGELEYIGRNDFQVKIRGFRIELGEIESTLNEYKGVKQAVVLARENKKTTNKYLVAYCTSIDGDKLNEEEVFSYLATKLPEYMIPSAIMHLDKLPLTLNGKLDRKALPDPVFGSNIDTYVAPRNKLESKLCHIFADVLGIEADKVGIDDNFFRLGGDSIVSIQLVSRIRQNLNINYITIKDIFTYKTIAKLYYNVIKRKIDKPETIKLLSEQGILTGNVPLLPIQTWFFVSKFEMPHHWNQAFIIKTPELNINILQKCIRELIGYHDAFRLRFSKNQAYYDNKAIPEDLKIIDISTLNHKDELHSMLTELQSNFNLQKGPTYSIAYIHGFNDDSSRIFFAFHHLIVDTVSWRILKQNLKDLYSQAIKEEKLSLGNKLTSYKQWSVIVNNYNNKQEKAYWANITKGIVNSNKLIQKFVTNNECNSNFDLSKRLTENLIKKANQTYHTQINDLLLTALSLSLSEILKTTINYITLEGHGREDSISKDNIDISNTLGWFTTMYPVELSIKDDIGDSIKHIKETLRQVPNNGVGYGAIMGYSKLPLIVFNYLGQLDQSGQDDGWAITGEDSGITVSTKNKDRNIININGAVVDSKLSFNVSSKLENSLHDKLVKLLNKQLKNVINHTSSLGRSYITPSDISNIMDQNYLDSIQDSKEVTNVFLANSLQQGFIYHFVKQGNIDDSYVVQMIWQYNNKLNVELLKQAWSCAQIKYPALRLRFLWDNELTQIIDKRANLDFRYIDLSKTKDIKEQEKEIKDIQQKDRNERYNLKAGNLFRVYLIKQKDDLYTCIFSNHHSILDGWSMPVLMGYVHSTYLNLFYNKVVDVKIEEAYIEAQAYIQITKHNNDEYWKQQLNKVDEYINLNHLISNREVTNSLNNYRIIKEHKTKNININGKLYKNLKLLGKQNFITLNAILQYVWHKVLSIYGSNNSGGNTTIVGTTVSGRGLPVNNIESSVGLYIITLPLIVEHNSNDTVLDAINKLQKNITEMNIRSNTNLAKLQTDGMRLFDTLFVYENYPIPVDNNDILNIKFKEAIERLDYPIAVIAYDSNKELSLSLKYAGELFNNSTIDRVLSTLNTLLTQVTKILENPLLTVDNLSYLNKQEEETILRKWNDTDRVYPSNKTIHSLFEEQVLKSPNNIAVIYEDVKLTYKELNEKANQLAHYLIKHHNIKPDSLITLLLNRSECMIISILGVLKAGAAYVPMDPEYPEDRIKYILNDTKTDIVITNEIYNKKVNKINKKVSTIAIDDSIQKLDKYPITNPIIDNLTSNNLSYVIYTSGTTGKPKGVQIEHHSVVNVILYLNKNIYNKHKQNISAFTSYTFDVSVLEFFCALIYGNSLNILSNTTIKDALLISKYINEHSINYLYLPPVVLSQLSRVEYKTLDKIVYGGEPCDRNTALYWSTSCKLYNYYGPAEGTICVTGREIINDNVGSIGSPIANSKAYVLSSELLPLPIGAIGELYVSGVGLARGYLNKPDVTKEKFIPNPFQSDKERQANKNARLYKTGDLVRWLSSGELEYVGRNDFQVKIRGFRIELGEIESSLNEYKGVKQAVVLARENKKTTNKYHPKIEIGKEKSCKELEKRGK